MATFTAAIDGAISAGATWGNVGDVKGTHWPSETDDAVFGTKDLTQGTATELGSMTGSSGCSLTLTGNFKCVDVSEVPIIVPTGVTATIDFGNLTSDPGCVYSGSNNAVDVAGTLTDLTGKILNTGTGRAIRCPGGTVTDATCKITNEGAGGGAYNENGTWNDFSGDIYNTGSGTGAYCDMGTWNDFSGDIYNTGDGIGVNNAGGTWTAFTGNLHLGSLGGSGIDGDAIPFSGDIDIVPQADLLAANILSGKTILGVTGTDPRGGGMLIID